MCNQNLRHIFAVKYGQARAFTFIKLASTCFFRDGLSHCGVSLKEVLELLTEHRKESLLSTFEFASIEIGGTILTNP